jgi:hypothetical protein
MTPQFEAARAQARKFLVAATRCMEPVTLPNGMIQQLWVPALVCCAFSVEIGIKALALHDLGGSLRGHNLGALFRELPTARQTEIADATSAYYPGSREHFDADLALVADVFEEFRYVHEQAPSIGGNTDLGFLQRIAAAIDSVLWAIR